MMRWLLKFFNQVKRSNFKRIENLSKINRREKTRFVCLVFFNKPILAVCWHTRNRYRDAIGTVVFKWQYPQSPVFRTTRSMCFLNKRTIQDSQTRSENSANQIKHYYNRQKWNAALDKSISKGLGFNKHFLT